MLSNSTCGDPIDFNSVAVLPHLTGCPSDLILRTSRISPRAKRSKNLFIIGLSKFIAGATPRNIPSGVVTSLGLIILAMYSMFPSFLVYERSRFPAIS